MSANDIPFTLFEKIDITKYKLEETKKYFDIVTLIKKDGSEEVWVYDNKYGGWR